MVDAAPCLASSRAQPPVELPAVEAPVHPCPPDRAWLPDRHRNAGTGKRRSVPRRADHEDPHPGRRPLPVAASRIAPGQAADTQQLIALLDQVRMARPEPGRARKRPKSLTGDRAYSSRANRKALRDEHITATIPQPPTRSRIACARAATAAAHRGSTQPPTSGQVERGFKPAQALACARHPLRQVGRPRPGHPRPRRDARLATRRTRWPGSTRHNLANAPTPAPSERHVSAPPLLQNVRFA